MKHITIYKYLIFITLNSRQEVRDPERTESERQRKVEERSKLKRGEKQGLYNKNINK